MGTLPAVTTQRSTLPVCRWRLQLGDLASVLPADKLLRHLQWESCLYLLAELQTWPGERRHLERGGGADSGLASPALGTPAMWGRSWGGRGSVRAASSGRL